MDPNATLEHIRYLVPTLLDEEDPDPQDVIELAEHVEALDNWMSKGGLVPDAWDSGGAE